jgi:uncharacterized membrane protein
MEKEIFLLTVPQFCTYWPFIEKCLDATEETWAMEHTKESLRDEILRGGLQVWTAGTPEAIVLVLFTRVVTSEVSRAVQVVWACGHLEDYAGILNVKLENFAKTTGCSRLEVVGRAGWQRILKPLGFHLTATIMSRPITNLTRH